MEDGFYVDKNKYDRTEVVAMEWLVQEVLTFKCFVSTIHNFLWYYSKAVKADEIIDELARYLAVVALLDHERKLIVVYITCHSNQHYRIFFLLNSYHSNGFFYNSLGVIGDVNSALWVPPVRLLIRL